MNNEFMCFDFPNNQDKLFVYNLRTAKHIFVESNQINNINPLNYNDFFENEVAIPNVQTNVFQFNVANTRKCNMNCRYCYDHQDNKENFLNSSFMTNEIGKKIIDELLISSGDLTDLGICFIGGEALVHQSVIECMVNYAEEKSGKYNKTIYFTIYTNGTLLTNKIVKWANDHNVSFVLSLDGNANVHNKNRRYLSGRGTHADVIKAAKLILEEHFSPNKEVRAVFDDPNESPIDVLDYLVGLGFNRLSIVPSYNAENIGYDKHVEKWKQLCTHYHEYLKNNLIVSLSPFTEQIKRIIKPKHFITSYYPCNIGSSALGIDSEGDIYPCHHFWGETDMKIANIKNGVPSLDSRKSLYFSVEERNDCRNCWAKHICGGECYHRSYTIGKGYSGVDRQTCKEKKELITHNIKLTASLIDSYPEVVHSLLSNNYSNYEECKSYAVHF